MAVNTDVDQKELQKAFAEEVFIQAKPEVKMTYQEGTLSFEVEKIPSAEKYELYYRPVLEELSFENQKRKTGTKGNAFANAEVVVTGTINEMNAHTAGEVLKSLGASVMEKPSASTNYIIVGDDPNPMLLGMAIAANVKILSATQFSRMLTETEV